MGGAGVLGFVHKNVVDASVELIEHPVDTTVTVQQVAGLVDQVLVIEQGAGVLFRLVTGNQRLGKDK